MHEARYGNDRVLQQVNEDMLQVTAKSPRPPPPFGVLPSASPSFWACFAWEPNTVLSSCYWLMEALRGTDFAGTQASPPGEENGKEDPLSPPPTAHHGMSGRDSGYTDRGDTAVSGSGDDGGEFESDGSRGAGAAGKRFFEFYPFLNDAAVNEMDGEAR